MQELFKAAIERGASDIHIKAGDVILEFAGKKLSSLEDLQEAMMAVKPGDKVKVRFRRDGKEQEIEIQTEQRG